MIRKGLAGWCVVLILCFTAAGAQFQSPRADNSNTSEWLGKRVEQLDKEIWAVFQSANGHYWFASDGRGVYRFDGKHLVQFTTADGLCHDRVRGIQEDKQGNLFISTLDGISKFDGRQFITLRPGPTVVSKWRLHPDDLWFPGKQAEGSVYRYDGESLYRLTLPRPNEMALNHVLPATSANADAQFSRYDVYRIYRDRKGALWFGTADAGACRYDGSQFEWLYEDHLTNVPAGGSFGIRSILEDRQGKFWICNSRFRFVIEPPRAQPNHSTKMVYRREPGIRGIRTSTGENEIYFQSIVEDNQGELWMVTYQEGVWRYDGARIRHYPIQIDGQPIKLFSIYQDAGGDLWLSSPDSGALKFNGKEFEPFSIPAG